MTDCRVHLPATAARSYPIKIGASLFALENWLPTATPYSRIFIITDNTVKQYYGLDLQAKLLECGYPCELVSFPAGEVSKNAETKQVLEQALLAHNCERNALILALGGGVVGDLAGFIAGTYLRGVPYIQIPTTLLAMVDSSVGGKTGINTPQGKNLLGLIYQPQSVVVDVTLLKTLSSEQMINGLVEAIKMFLTSEASSLAFVDVNLDAILAGEKAALHELVTRAVAIKAGIVSRDETECGERSILNCGHTIGHALEKISQYSLLHGYAVAYGILVEAEISHAMGILPNADLQQIKVLLARLGIQGRDLQQYDVTDLIAATKKDKKVQQGKVQYVLLQSLGRTYVEQGRYVHPVDDELVQQALMTTVKG